MEKSRRFFWIILIVVIIILLLHIFFHTIIYGSNISGFYQNGLQSLSTGKTGILESIRSNSNLKIVSIIAIISEWIFLGAALTFINIIRRKTKKEENVSIMNLNSLERKVGTETDIDLLYNLVKKNKSIKISIAAKLFKVDNEKIIEWCRILESANLATINYPRLSEPEISLM